MGILNYLYKHQGMINAMLSGAAAGVSGERPRPKIPPEVLLEIAKLRIKKQQQESEARMRQEVARLAQQRHAETQGRLRANDEYNRTRDKSLDERRAAERAEDRANQVSDREKTQADLLRRIGITQDRMDARKQMGKAEGEKGKGPRQFSRADREGAYNDLVDSVVSGDAALRQRAQDWYASKGLEEEFQRDLTLANAEAAAAVAKTQKPGLGQVIRGLFGGGQAASSGGEQGPAGAPSPSVTPAPPTPGAMPSPSPTPAPAQVFSSTQEIMAAGLPPNTPVKVMSGGQVRDAIWDGEKVVAQ